MATNHLLPKFMDLALECSPMGREVRPTGGWTVSLGLPWALALTCFLIHYAVVQEKHTGQDQCKGQLLGVAQCDNAGIQARSKGGTLGIGSW